MIRWLRAWFKARAQFAAQVNLDAKCPWCGHFGCTIRAVSAKEADKNAVERKCNTCGGLCYEPTVGALDKLEKK